jgi:hypothetical protein
VRFQNVSCSKSHLNCSWSPNLEPSFPKLLMDIVHSSTQVMIFIHSIVLRDSFASTGPWFTHNPHSAYFPALKMEPAGSSETLLCMYQTIVHDIISHKTPQISNLPDITVPLSTALQFCTLNMCSVSARGVAGRTPIRTRASASMRSIVFSSLRYQGHTARRQGRTAQPRREIADASIIYHISFLGLSPGIAMAYQTADCMVVRYSCTYLPCGFYWSGQ